MLYIKVPDMNDSMSTLSIDGVEYLLRFTYNEKYDYWSFGLYSSEEEPYHSHDKNRSKLPDYALLHIP